MLTNVSDYDFRSNFEKQKRKKNASSYYITEGDGI